MVRGRNEGTITGHGTPRHGGTRQGSDGHLHDVPHAGQVRPGLLDPRREGWQAARVARHGAGVRRRGEVRATRTSTRRATNGPHAVGTCFNVLFGVAPYWITALPYCSRMPTSSSPVTTTAR